MTNDALLIRSRRAWPWGLVLISDSDSRELLPERSDGVVVAANSALAVRVLHEVDGEATVEVRSDHKPQGLLLIHEGKMDIPSGAIQVSDAAGDLVVSASLETGSHSVRIYVDNETHPERVIVTLDRPA